MLLDGVSKIFDITMFGAISDGNTLCTKSFDKAISECEKRKEVGLFMFQPVAFDRRNIFKVI